MSPIPERFRLDPPLPQSGHDFRNSATLLTHRASERGHPSHPTAARHTASALLMCFSTIFTDTPMAAAISG